MNDAWHYQIKAAQRDLITMAGGIERAANLTGFAKSTIGRWNNPGDPELMPLSAIRSLERETDQPLITTIMAHETGRKVLEPNGPISDAAVLEELGRSMMMDVAELVSTITNAARDNHISPAEGVTIGNPTARLRDTVRKIEQFVGAVKAGGGMPADLRLVAGD
jgi:hypothetical protein